MFITHLYKEIYKLLNNNYSTYKSYLDKYDGRTIDHVR